MGVRSLLLTTTFPPSVGGVETLLYQASRRLKCPPLVIAPTPASDPSGTLQVIRVTTTPTGLAGRAVYRAMWTLHPSLHYLRAFLPVALRAAMRHRPRVIQCGHAYLGPVAWLVARRLRRPLVMYTYGQEVWRGGRRVGPRPLDNLLRGGPLRDSDAVLALGSFTSSLLHEWQVDPRRVVCPPYGAEPRPSVDPPSGATILTVGRLVPRKGVDTVIRALPTIARAVPEVQYRVVGSGPDEGRLHALARECGVAERVQFLGRVDEPTLARAYEECALFVLPARREGKELEGYGLVYFEAAAWGRPVIAGRSGGEVDAVVDGVTGRLVDGASVGEVAQAVRDLLRAPQTLRAMGEAGRRRVEQTHNWNTAARVVDETLTRVALRAGV